MPTHDADLDLPIQALIDRMIDGEMSPLQVRTCIERLDSAPEGWRDAPWRSWRRRAGEKPSGTWTRHPASEASQRRFAAPVPAARAPCVTRGWASTALAAGIALIAFSLGWMSHGLNTRGKPAVAPVETVSLRPGGPAIGDPESPATRTPGPGSIAGLPTDRVPTVREVARLRFGTGDQAAAEVPILAGPGIGGRWLLAAASSGLRA